MADFAIFPVPPTETGKAAVNYIKSKRPDANIMNFVPASHYTDPTTGRSVPIPGNPQYIIDGTDPYYDFIQLATDLGADSVDLDYEEIWYADTYHTGKKPGPYHLDQVIYKNAFVAYEIQ